MNNAQRRLRAARERMDPELYLKQRRADGLRRVIPLRYLSHVERAEYLERATSPLSP